MHVHEKKAELVLVWVLSHAFLHQNSVCEGYHEGLMPILSVSFQPQKRERGRGFPVL